MLHVVRRQHPGGERATIQLAIRREGQRLDVGEQARHHVLRQAFTQRGAEFRHEVGAARTVEHEERHQALIAHDGDGGIPHLPIAAQSGLDLTELDAEAADLHLRVEAAEELEPAFTIQPDAVTRAIRPGARLLAR